MRWISAADDASNAKASPKPSLAIGDAHQPGSVLGRVSISPLQATFEFMAKYSLAAKSRYPACGVAQDFERLLQQVDVNRYLATSAAMLVTG